MHDRQRRDAAVLARRRHTPSSNPNSRHTNQQISVQEASASNSSSNPSSSNNDNTRLAEKWIIQYHDAWSRLTLSSFYQHIEERSLNTVQFARWLLDRASISIAILEGATRISLLLNQSNSPQELPLLKIAKENAQFLAETTTLNGLDIHSQYRLSHPAKRLVELIESSTSTDSSLIVAITSIWGYMLASWQAWALCKMRGRPIPNHFKNIADYLSREDSISEIVRTQKLLDQLLSTSTDLPEIEKAGKTFEEIARRSCAVLDHTLYMGEGNHVPLCTCGRKGHYPAQCTFKSHI